MVPPSPAACPLPRRGVLVAFWTKTAYYTDTIIRHGRNKSEKRLMAGKGGLNHLPVRARLLAPLRSHVDDERRVKLLLLRRGAVEDERVAEADQIVGAARGLELVLAVLLGEYPLQQLALVAGRGGDRGQIARGQEGRECGEVQQIAEVSPGVGRQVGRVRVREEAVLGLARRGVVEEGVGDGLGDRQQRLACDQGAAMLLPLRRRLPVSLERASKASRLREGGLWDGDSAEQRGVYSTESGARPETSVRIRVRA